MQRLRGWNKLATMPKNTRVAERLGGDQVGLMSWSSSCSTCAGGEEELDFVEPRGQPRGHFKQGSHEACFTFTLIPPILVENGVSQVRAGSQ